MLQNQIQTHKHKIPANLSIAPYFGLSNSANVNQALVLGLQYRGVAGTPETSITLDAPTGSGAYQYFAYPASYGLVDFLDTDSNFTGGWDGANDNPMEVYGPVTIMVQSEGFLVPFYVYRTDYAELGLCHWTITKQ